MRTNKRVLMWAMLPVVLATGLAVANTSASITAAQLGSSWAEANFSESSSNQMLHKTAISNAEKAVSVNGNDPEILAWAGIIQASYAGKLKGLSALNRAKKARKLLLAAMELDPEALDGGARSTLGVLYYKVPPWPIGFGNKKRAETLLSESASNYPTSLNAQFFYGEYLLDQNRQSEAKRVLEQARSIPARPEFRPVDEARHSNIDSYLSEL